MPQYIINKWTDGVKQWGDTAFFAKIPLEGFEVIELKNGNILLPMLKITTLYNNWYEGIISLPTDHVFASDDIQIIDRNPGPNLRSDHRPLVVDIQL